MLRAHTPSHLRLKHPQALVDSAPGHQELQNDCLSSHFSFLVLVFAVPYSIRRFRTLSTAVYLL
jgi:hypothetical protein